MFLILRDMLFEHQEIGVKFLKENKRAILADEMGLGKTRQAIVAAEEVGDNVLIICPASLKMNWAREILAVQPEAAIRIVNGHEVDQYATGMKQLWLIINYDVVHRSDNLEMLEFMNFGTAIIDEAHYIKSSKSIRSKAVVELVSGRIDNVFLLTGTPILNRPEELYMLLKAISHPLGNNWHSYVMRYCGAYWRETGRKKFNKLTGQYEPLRFLDVSGATNLQELHKELSKVYLRRTKDVLGDKLPSKIIANIPVELSAQHRRLYNGAWDSYMDYLDNNPIIFSDLTEEERQEKIDNIIMTKHLVELQKLKQVVSTAKISKVVEDVEQYIENDEKIIIFTQYTASLEELKKQLDKLSIKSVVLHGSTSQEDRQKAIDSFQHDSEVKVFIGNLRAAGVGITLTAASTVMFLDMEFTPALHQQAEDRAHRIGQSRQVNVYYYIAKNTIEEHIVELLDRKNKIIKSILEGENERARQVNVAAELIKRLSTVERT